MINYKKEFMFIIAIILTIGFFATSFVSYFVSRNSIIEKIEKSELPLTSDNIYSEIERDLLKPVFISSLMASNTFLKDWVINGEKDDKKVIKYLKKIKNKYKTLTSFYVSEKTRKYYQSNVVLKKVSKDNPRDKWYFRAKNIKRDYEINVDLDMANQDALTIFVNHKVFDYNKNFIGVTGIGLSIYSVQKLILKYQKKYSRNVYFLDLKGNIVLNAKGSIKDKNIKDITGVSSLSKKILSSKTLSSSFENNGSTTHLNSRFIPELNWYLIVEETSEASFKEIYKTLIINLIISILITIIVIILLNFTLNAYKNKVTKLVQEDKKLREINQEQEIKIEDALAEVKKLSGFLPICSSCKNIRDDKGFWNEIETYVQENSEAQFSHSICPDCIKDLYPDLNNEEL